MTDFRKLAFVGLMGLGLVSVGCGSKTTDSGTGGSTGNGGSTGSGGSTAKGGAGGSSSTGGSTGSGGSSSTGGAAGGTAACVKAPDDGIIADFTGDGGIEIMGGLAAYGGTATPTHSTTGGILNIMENNAAGSAAQYVGTVLYFNTCIDASAFSGIEFMLGGSFSGCTIQYSTNDAPHDDMSTDPKGTCTLGAGMCYSPQASIATVSATAAQIMQPWATVAGGAPPLATDPTQLTGIQWQFTIPPAADGGANTCTANLNISQIKFYH